MFAAEKKLSLNDARKIPPYRPSLVTMWCWCRRGIKGVKLEYQRVGRRIFTSQEAMERFFNALAEADDSPAAGIFNRDSQTSRTATAKKRSIATAKQALAAAGI